MDAEYGRTPGIPGVLGNLMWVNTYAWERDPDGRPRGTLVSVDPSPLARVLAIHLDLVNDNPETAIRAVADDERDGPVHLVHLLVACEHAAQRTGGGMPRSGDPTEPIEVLMQALTSPTDEHDDGFEAAIAAARAMDSETRYHLLHLLVDYWLAPITALRDDLGHFARRLGETG